MVAWHGTGQVLVQTLIRPRLINPNHHAFSAVATPHHGGVAASLGMSNLEPSSAVIAVRVYPDTRKAELDLQKEKKDRGRWRLPNTIFVWDTETRIDQTQRLTFGSYRLLDAGQLVKENLFYGPTLPARDRRI